MIPFWLTLGFSLFVAFTLLVYRRHYGWQNYLWFSDIALVTTALGLWLQSPLLIGITALSVLIPDLLWNISYFGRLIGGKRLLGLTDYMFDRRLSRPLRALSLFHVGQPLILIYALAQLGYDPRALPLQCLIAVAVLLASYRYTPPEKNINWVLGLYGQVQTRFHPWLYLLLLYLGFVLLVYAPTHVVLVMVFAVGLW
ncbi:membrane-associated protein [Pseudomarimonas arenosa]|uniref:Membrane-associated protein n=1 Tax=Pseudomarimonas arenosa TaxID=2774145 RepID=A0AAW3ZMK1_9GAMM|nr:membrane-associated protein [Pseudomarimonas arenosa]MBD8526759.1 membrane-associated protein [Pseudomarimonas arenosa]